MSLEMSMKNAMLMPMLAFGVAIVADNVTAFPSPVREIPGPLGFYLRPGHSDHIKLTNVLLERSHKLFGAVIDPTLVQTQKVLIEQLLKQNLDVILDPKTQASAFLHGFRQAMRQLPWCLDRPHVIDDFRELSGRHLVIKLAEFAIANGFTQVLSPSHFISSPNDPWFQVDSETSNWLRSELDRRGGKNIQTIYSLAIANEVFKDKEQRAAIIARLARMPFDSLWMKVDGFGADAAPSTLTSSFEALTDFHALDKPIVADSFGGLPGLAILAFGAVGGICHGITQGEKFSTSSWRKRKPSTGGGGGWRVYVPNLGLSFTKSEADVLFSVVPSARAKFGNRNTEACPRGVDDMIKNPVRSFVVQRGQEIAEIGATPELIRPQQFLEKTVRPLTDCAVVATKINWKPDDIIGQKLKKRFELHRERVENIRIALGAYNEKSKPTSFAKQPMLRIARANV
jgi:hypothetical protein